MPRNLQTNGSDIPTSSSTQREQVATVLLQHVQICPN